jgi:hypothetical protein
MSLGVSFFLQSTVAPTERRCKQQWRFFFGETPAVNVTNG